MEFGILQHDTATYAYKIVCFVLFARCGYNIFENLNRSNFYSHCSRTIRSSFKDLNEIFSDLEVHPLFLRANWKMEGSPCRMPRPEFPVCTTLVNFSNAITAI